jgi:hypothetical protein
VWRARKKGVGKEEIENEEVRKKNRKCRKRRGYSIEGLKRKVRDRRGKQMKRRREGRKDAV